MKRGYSSSSKGASKRVAGRSPAIAAILAAKKRSRMANAMIFGNAMPGRLVSVRGEVNAVDLPAASYALNTTGSIVALNLVRSGSTYVNRTGRRIEMKNVRISGLLGALRTANASDYVRIAVVYDRQTNGALPSLSDVFQTTDQAAANTQTGFSGANLNNRDRFVILMDQRICVPSQTVTAGQISTPGWQDQQQSQIYVERFIKLGGLLTQFKADSSPAVIGDIATGGLYLITFGGIVAGSEGWSATLETRLRFTDTH